MLLFFFFFFFFILSQTSLLFFYLCKGHKGHMLTTSKHVVHLLVDPFSTSFFHINSFLLLLLFSLTSSFGNELGFGILISQFTTIYSSSMQLLLTMLFLLVLNTFCKSENYWIRISSLDLNLRHVALQMV